MIRKKWINGYAALANWSASIESSALPSRTFVTNTTAPDVKAIKVPHSSSVSFSTACSLFVWIKTTDTTNNAGIFTKSNYTGGKRCYALETWSNGKYALYMVSSNGTTSQAKYGQTVINDGRWHLVGFTYDAGTVVLYVDGETETLTTLTDPGNQTSLSQQATTDVMIGCLLDGTTPTLPFQGSIFQPLLVNRALTTTEVLELYDLGWTGTQTISQLSFFSSIKAAYKLSAADSSSSVLDESGNGNTGTWVEETVAGDFTANIPGMVVPSTTTTTSVSLNGSSKYLWTADAAELSGLKYATVGLWVKGNSGGEAGIFGKADYGINTREWFIERHWADGTKISVFNSDDGSNQQNVVSTATVFDNTWKFVVWTKDATTAKLYINGSLDASGSAYATLYDGTAKMALGILYNSGTPALYFDGKLDEAFVLKKALSASQVSSLYTSYATLYSRHYGSLLVHYRCGDHASDTTSTIVNGASAGTYDMTAVNLASGDLVSDVHA